MTSIGVDLSKRTLYLACVKEPKTVSTVSLDIVDNPFAGFQSLVVMLSSYRDNLGAEKVYIEQPWANSRSPRPMSFLDLGRAAAFVEIAALSVGLKPVFVLPSEWRKVVYSSGRPKDVKELARDTVLKLFDYQTKYKYEHNKCEAILLAHYGNLIRNNTNDLETIT